MPILSLNPADSASIVQVLDHRFVPADSGAGQILRARGFQLNQLEDGRLVVALVLWSDGSRSATLSDAMPIQAYLLNHSILTAGMTAFLRSNVGPSAELTKATCRSTVDWASGVWIYWALKNCLPASLLSLFHNLSTVSLGNHK